MKTESDVKEDADEVDEVEEIEFLFIIFLSFFVEARDIVCACWQSFLKCVNITEFIAYMTLRS